MNANNTALSSPVGIDLFLSVLNIFLSITACLGNVMILVVLQRVSSIHPPTKLLFRCLAVSDLCVALISQPIHATSLLKRNLKMNSTVLSYATQVNYLFSFILCEASIFTSTAISVDRLLALLLGLKYRIVVTLWRVRAIIICFWLIGFSDGLMFIFLSQDIAFTVAIVLSVMSVFISVFSYTRIFFILRRRQAQVTEQPNGSRISLNITKYKETVSSIGCVQVALVICYVPFIITATLETYAKTIQIAWDSIVTLLFFSSTLNPIIYSWRIRGLRRAMKDTVRKFCCPSSLTTSVDQYTDEAVPPSPVGNLN